MLEKSRVNSLIELRNFARTNTLQHSSRTRLSWICRIRCCPTTHRLRTYKALIASAATNMGNRDAIMRTWLSAARMDKNKKATKRKKAAAPGWRPCRRGLNTDSSIDRRKGTHDCPIANERENNSAEEKERDVHQGIRENERKCGIKTILGFSIVCRSFLKNCDDKN